LRVQKLFYPEKVQEGQAAPCHCYFVHPPGGMASGDEISVRCVVEDGAHCLVTSPSAAKVYRMDSWRRPQRQDIVFEVNNAALEWLPQETILFDGAGAEFSSLFRLKGNSRLIAWDIAGLGRPAAGEVFRRGHFLQSTAIWREERPLLRERLDMDADGGLWSGLAGLGSHTVIASVFACGCGPDDDALTDARNRLQEMLATSGGDFRADGKAGVTYRAGVLAARWLGDDCATARRFCLRVWRVVRPLLLGREICPPRIWFT
jgi:urease accessory protein